LAIVDPGANAGRLLFRNDRCLLRIEFILVSIFPQLRPLS
jgi:hypothetical protein